MQLWTYHRSTFPVDGSQSIDPTTGRFWWQEDLRYKDSLTKLQLALNINYFPLWCYTVKEEWCYGCTHHGQTEWRLEVPEAEVLAFISSTAWDDYIKQKSDDWHNVILTNRPIKPHPWVTAVLQFPLSSEWGKVYVGLHVNPQWQADAQRMTTYSPEIRAKRMRELQQRAINESLDRCVREEASGRLAYLEECQRHPVTR